MSTGRAVAARHPAGEQPSVEYGKERSVIADTFAGRVHVEWEEGEGASMTPLGQLPFFIEDLKQGGLFDGWVAGCPLSLTSPNAPSKRDILGTVMLSVLAGHRRYAHITTLRCDPVNPPLLGMTKVVSEDAVRRALSKIEAEAGQAWLQEQLDYCTRPLLGEPWILDVDTTVKPLYGHQEGAVLGYNPKKPGRPSHTYHSYMLANLRLVLEVEVQAGNQHAAKHSAPGLWTLLDRLRPQGAPWLLRGGRDWGNEGVISAAERRGQAYLFKLRLTKRVKRVLERAMREEGLVRRRRRLARQARRGPAHRLEPTAAGRDGAPPFGRGGDHPAWDAWAARPRPCRDRRGAPGTLGICCSGDLVRR